MNIFYILIYHLWKFLARYIYADSFLQTVNVPISEFAGHYYEIARTPNWFQRPNTLASAVYQVAGSHAKSFHIRVKNIEYGYKERADRSNGRMLQQTRMVKGTLFPIPQETGNFLLSFDTDDTNNFEKSSWGVGLYRVLRYQSHPRWGSFLFVSSYSPQYSWLLWKPPLDKSNLSESYRHALQLLDWFSQIGVLRSEITVTQPDDLYRLLEINQFV